MKIRLRQLSPSSKSHAPLTNLKGLTASNIKLPLMISHGPQFEAFERDFSREQINQEIERKQSASRAYANMLPPR